MMLNIRFPNTLVVAIFLLSITCTFLAPLQIQITESDQQNINAEEKRIVNEVASEIMKLIDRLERVEREKGESLDRAKELQDKSTKANQDLGAVHAQLQVLLAEKRVVDQQVQRFQAKIAELKAELKRLKDSAGDNIATGEQLRLKDEALAEAQGNIAQLEADLRRVQGELAGSQQESLVKDQKIKELEERVRVLEAENAALQTKLQDAEQRVSELTKNLEELNATLSEVQGALDAEQENNGKLLGKHEGDIAKKVAEIATLTAALAAARSGSEDARGLQALLAGKEEELQQLLEQFARLQEENNFLSERVEQLEAWGLGVKESFEQQAAKFVSFEEKLRQDHENEKLEVMRQFQLFIEKLKEKDVTIAGLQARIAAEKELALKILKRLRLLSGISVLADDQREQIAQLEAELLSKVAKIEQLEASLQARGTEKDIQVAGLASKLAEKEDQISHLTQQFNDAQRRFAELQQAQQRESDESADQRRKNLVEIQQLQELTDRLQRELAAAQARSAELQVQLAQALQGREVSEDLRARIETLTADHNRDLQARDDQHQEALEALRAEHAQALKGRGAEREALRVSHQSEIDSLNAQNQAALQELTERHARGTAALEKQIQLLQQEMASLREQVVELTQKLGESNLSKQRVEKQSVELREQLGEKAAELERAKRDVSVLGNQARSFYQQFLNEQQQKLIMSANVSRLNMALQKEQQDDAAQANEAAQRAVLLDRMQRMGQDNMSAQSFQQLQLLSHNLQKTESDKEDRQFQETLSKVSSLQGQIFIKDEKIKELERELSRLEQAQRPQTARGEYSRERNELTRDIERLQREGEEERRRRDKEISELRAEMAAGRDAAQQDDLQLKLKQMESDQENQVRNMEARITALQRQKIQATTNAGKAFAAGDVRVSSLQLTVNQRKREALKIRDLVLGVIGKTPPASTSSSSSSSRLRAAGSAVVAARSPSRPSSAPLPAKSSRWGTVRKDVAKKVANKPKPKASSPKTPSPKRPSTSSRNRPKSKSRALSL